MNPLPDLPSPEFDDLRDSIAERGVLSPILFADDGATLIDGHQRTRAWTELGRPPEDIPSLTLHVPPSRAVEVGLIVNTLRRHLTRDERNAVIVRLAALGMTQREVAKTVGITQSAVSKEVTKAKAKGVIPWNNSSLTTTEAQQALGKSPTSKRGGRPPKMATEEPSLPYTVPVIDLGEDAAAPEEDEEPDPTETRRRVRELTRVLSEAKALALKERMLLFDMDPAQRRHMRTLAKTTSKAILFYTSDTLADIQ